jgi:hypothetical protein
MMQPGMADNPECWPELPLAKWRDTYATLHLWTQVVGKIRLRLAPLVNHWWNVPLYVTARGLTTSMIPYGERAFELRFDFLAHDLVLESNDGSIRRLALRPMAVADFYRDCLDMVRSAGFDIHIWRMPVEIADPIAFDEDRVHGAYDAAWVERFWRILLSVDAVLQEFRSRFIGKSSPVHFFWGSFDLAVTRFSGRRAPARPNADAITREAYSHEVSSIGFWPGGSGVNGPAFYAYAAPEPVGFSAARVRPEAAQYDARLGEFLLMYDEVRVAESPSAALLAFCQTTYEAAANPGKWDRAALER